MSFFFYRLVLLSFTFGRFAFHFRRNGRSSYRIFMCRFKSSSIMLFVLFGFFLSLYGRISFHSSLVAMLMTMITMLWRITEA